MADDKELSPDERTCLMIAAQGQFMLAISRWKPAIESLVARGYMRQHDAVNYVITNVGMSIAQSAENALAADSNNQAFELKQEIAQRQRQMQVHVQKAGEELARAILVCRPLNGELDTQIMMRLGPMIRDHALRILSSHLEIAALESTIQ